MLSKKTLRLVLLGAPILGLAAAAMVLAFGPGTGDQAQAGGGVQFAIGIDYNGDGTNDCGTGVPSAVGDGAPDDITVAVSNIDCAATPGDTLDVYVYLTDNAGTAYEAAASHVYYTGGVTSKGNGLTVWTGHLFDAFASGVGFENAGSAIGFPPAGPQTNLGLMSTFSFNCSAGGTISLGHGVGETIIQASGVEEQREAGGTDLLNVCGGGEPTDPPPPTDTPTVPGDTPTPTNTSVPTTPPAATNTPTPTNTMPPTATHTPTTPPGKGDVNGDGLVNAEDSLWILWEEAGIVDEVPLPENADVNHDGSVSSIDALWILWIEGDSVQPLT